VTTIDNSGSGTANPAPPDLLPLSLLNDYLFCPRRAGLKLLEGLRGVNEHTAAGDVVHERADTPGYSTAGGVVVLRAVQVWSARLGLIGRCDLVEKHPDGSYVPVEYKKGPRRQFENDDVQVCAQALCLEEALGVRVARGAIFFAASKRRREVEMTDELRRITAETAAELHRLLAAGVTPWAERKPLCEKCSLVAECLPASLRFTRGAAAWFAARLQSDI
jgi:CRISPR-associated exonuclease Cas4